MMQIHHLKKQFDHKILFHDFSYLFPDTGIVCICGESGSGKTTLLRMLAGLDIQYEGSIQIKENTKMSYVFQEDRMLATCTVLENVLLPLKQDKNALEKALYWLKKVDLLEEKNAYPNTLSKGMKQRVNIARAMAFEADVVLMDEPFSNIDEKKAYALMDCIKKEAMHRLFIIVTHNSNYLSYLEANTIFMEKALVYK